MPGKGYLCSLWIWSARAFVVVREFYRCIVEACSSPLIAFECARARQAIVYANPALERLTGFQADELLGRDWRALFEEGVGPSSRAPLAATGHGREERLLLRSRRKDGRFISVEVCIVPLRDENAIVTHYVGVVHEITASHYRPDQLEYRAFHDPLTGLPNRYLFRDRFEEAVARAQQDGGSFSVLFIDLNGFKLTNDTFGHAVGDELLRRVAARLAAAIRAEDTVARFGGDEFVLLIQGDGGSAQMIDRIEDAFREPVTVDHHRIRLSCSVGQSMFPDDGADLATLLRKADRVMYDEKVCKPLVERTQRFLPDRGRSVA
jgi:diguanylate cyclase (GGDEF)-like protein/PAS domain S-box-containing protein